ncbi:hypothetical protein H310_14452 [Aphanomyces invadans]|uniref:EF-hand domain-containing protein n=1 Tax=Aphanomyces invadans TaxID=157072 RepID=A0A024TB80_9STRA|nr:hypothetical protein H310_14452 [Aphanomyces invadans]ETV90856.1 hypothetical protein H310_14452 [Aphanomyces invadans]|eukprot:XP_008880534.1 hypothetical protein H310_14452 [Aphanomyces invadans]
MRRGTVRVEYCPILDQVVVLEGEPTSPRLCRQRCAQHQDRRSLKSRTSLPPSPPVLQRICIPFVSTAAKAPLHPITLSSRSPRQQQSRPLTSIIDTRARPVPTCRSPRIIRPPLPESPSPSRAPHMSDQPSREDESETKNHNKELLWLHHRWFIKHGKPSNMKDERARMVLMRRWFEFLDTDGSGEIGLNELEDPLVSVGLAKCRLDVRQLIQTVDDSDNGEVNFDEFLSMMRGKKKVAAKTRPPLSAPKPKAAASGAPSPGSDDSCQPSHTAAQSPTHGGAEDEEANSVVRLFADLQQGKLGDMTLPFPILITAYRRRMLLNAHMAPLDCDRSQGHSVLTALEVTRREAAIQEEEDAIMREKQRQRRTSISHLVGDVLRREDVVKPTNVGLKAAVLDEVTDTNVRAPGAPRQRLRLPDLFD